MTITQKISNGYILLLVLTLVVAGTGLYILNSARNSYTTFIDVNQRVVLGITQLRASVARQGEAYRGFLLYGEEGFVTELGEASEEFGSEMGEMRKLVSDPQDRQTLAEIADLGS